MLISYLGDGGGVLGGGAESQMGDEIEYDLSVKKGVSLLVADGG